MHGYINGGWVATYLCGGKNVEKVEDVGKVMKVSVTPGKTYAVTTSEECTITSSDGTTIATCAAGEQMVFVAPCSTVDVSSDTAIIIESFRSASTGGNVSRGYVQDAIEEATEGLPEVDASGNMTLEGGLTAAGAINANGGINKPLTVLPTTAQSVVNRDDAFGAYCVQLAHSAPALITAVTSDGLTAKTVVPGQLYSFTAASTTVPKSGKITTTHELLSHGNYPHTRGFTIPLSPRIFEAGCSMKISFVLGRFKDITEKIDEDIDVFRISPKAGTAWSQFTENFVRFIDVTFYYDDVEDSNDSFKIRVRELRYINSSAKWVVKETITRVSSFNTYIRNVHNLTFHMANNVASLWAVVNGYWGVATVWLADLTPPSDLFDSNLLSSTLYVDMLKSTFFIGNPILFIPPGNNQQNGAYNAFKAVETRNLISETTYDFTPYELEES